MSRRCHLPKLRQKLNLCGMDLLDIPELIPDSGAVTTKKRIAPCHNAAICQNCSKSVVCGMDLLDIPELIRDSSAVTTTAWKAPCDNPVSSNTPQNHCSTGCSYFELLLCNSSNAVSTFEARRLEEVLLDSRASHLGQQV